MSTSERSDVSEIREASEKSLERQVRAYHWVRLLAELPGRRAGHAAEREAGARVAAWLHSLGIDETAFQPVPARPSPGASLALHLGTAAFGVWLGGLVGFALAALAALSFQRGRTGRDAWLARLLPTTSSQNLVARVGAAERPRRRVVLTADLDAAPAGHRLGRFAEAAAARGFDPDALFAYALVGAVFASGAELLGAGGFLLGFAKFALVVGLAAGAWLGFEATRAPASEGADVGGSGVAALLTCAEQLAAQLPPDVELWCAATGAGATGGAGVEALVAAHPEWIGDRTAFVHFDAVGRGALRYVVAEGGAQPCAYPPMLCELARRVAASGAYDDVRPLTLAVPTSAGSVARRGAPLLSVVAVEDGRLPRAPGRADDRAADVDAENVIRAADFAASVVSAHLRGDAEPLAYV